MVLEWGTYCVMLEMHGSLSVWIGIQSADTGILSEYQFKWESNRVVTNTLIYLKPSKLSYPGRAQGRKGNKTSQKGNLQERPTGSRSQVSPSVKAMACSDKILIGAQGLKVEDHCTRLVG